MPDLDLAGLIGPAPKRRRLTVNVLRKRTRKQVRNLPRYKKRPHLYVYRLWNRRYRSTYATRLDRVPARDELPALLNRRGLVGQGAEVRSEERRGGGEC